MRRALTVGGLVVAAFVIVFALLFAGVVRMVDLAIAALAGRRP